MRHSADSASPRTARRIPDPLSFVHRIRSSFGARLQLALLGLVVLVVGTMLAFVHRQTGEQVRVVTARAAAIAGRAFEEVEELHRVQLARLGRAFTDSRRTLAALEAALESNDSGWLVETARYELELARAGSSLAAFTDASGRVVATLIDGEPADGDPAGVARLARTLPADGSGSVVDYRVVGDRLFTVLTDRVVIGGRAIGTITFGLPVNEEVARHLADAAGSDVCFVADGRCIAGTVTDEQMAATLAAVSPGTSATVMSQGARWVLHAEPVTGETTPVRRVIAVPIDDALAPFERIRQVLAWTGLAALILAFGIASVLSHRMAQPVREIDAATRLIARGDFRARVPVRGHDELGELARSFNGMAEDLALKERYRDILKKVVSREIADDLIAGQLQLGGEVRTVTVVFADIVGFTGFAARTDPVTVITVLNECMTVWSRIIEEEAGVVDKYTGDAVMAVFGAPVSHPDDAGRALRAATRMQEATERLNADRLAGGRPEIRLAVGLATGPAVAGNVGSPDRLNYTVIGDTVNLASRLCDAAGAGEVLASRGTALAAGDAPNIVFEGERALKGMPAPVPVYSVGRRSTANAAGAIVARVTVAALALAGTLVAGHAHAQDRGPGLPTLAGLGASWMSRSGTFQLDFSGQLDAEAYLPQDAPSWLIPTTDPFVAGRIRLFADVFAGDRVYGMLELRADRGEAPSDGSMEARVEQVFVRLAPLPHADVQVQLGKFTMPFGGYGSRHHTVEDPLIRPPLAYEYRTLVSPTVIPGAAAGFLGWQDEASMRRPNGSPQVWNVPYPWGGMLSARSGNLAFHAALMGAAPSSGPPQWTLDADHLRNPSLVLGGAWQIVPELRVAVGFDRGPYLAAIESGSLPAGSRVSDFKQQIWTAEVVFARGRSTLRGEAFLDRWEVPNLADDPRDISWYVEGSHKLGASLQIAARLSEIRFRTLAAGSTSAAWDRDVRRVQLGAGYRILRNTGIRAEVAFNQTRIDDPRDNLISFQWWWAF